MQGENLFYVTTIRIFLSVCRHRNFSKAAKELNLSQPAVSMAISRLEKEIGTDLFIRERPLSLTSEARRLYRLFSDAAGELEAAINEVKLRQFKLTRFRLGVIDSLRDTMGVDLVEGIQTMASTVSLFSGTSNQLLQQLSQGALDLIIVGDVAEENLQKEFVFEEETIVIFPKKLAQERKISNWQQVRFSGLPLIKYSNSWSNNRIVEEISSSNKWKIVSRIDVDSSEFMLRLVADGLGWAVTHPCCLLGRIEELYDRIAVISPLTSTLKSRQIYAIYPKSTQIKQTRLIVRFVRDFYKNQLEKRQEECLRRLSLPNLTP